MQTSLFYHGIMGLGTDMLDIRRLERLFLRHPQRAMERLFTPSEQAYAQKQSRPIMAFAKRFAAKEAFVKALGRGIGRIGWRDMEVWNDELGKPALKLSPSLQAQLACLGTFETFLSLTDEWPYAQATVLIAKTYAQSPTQRAR